MSAYNRHVRPCPADWGGVSRADPLSQAHCFDQKVVIFLPKSGNSGQYVVIWPKSGNSGPECGYFGQKSGYFGPKSGDFGQK